MASRNRSRGGVTTREKVKLVLMAGFALVMIAAFVQMTGLMGGRAPVGPGRVLVDPDETTVLPEYDRSILADVTDRPPSTGPAHDGPVLTLVDLVAGDREISRVTGRGFLRPSVAELREAPATSRGDFVKLVGRVTGTSAVTLGDPGRLVQRIDLTGPDGGPFRVFSAKPAPADERVLKVLGIFLRVGPSAPDDDAAPVEIVAIRMIPSVMPERFEHVDPAWFRLVKESRPEERANLRTDAIFLTLAWARTLGPEGLEQQIEGGRLRVEDMPDANEVEHFHEKLKGHLFVVEGKLEGIFGDHQVPENRAGLESVYRLEVIHDLPGRRGFPVAALAPRCALPETLHAGNRVRLEGLYLKIWGTTNARGEEVPKPLLITPRVRRVDAPDTEER